MCEEADCLDDEGFSLESVNPVCTPVAGGRASDCDEEMESLCRRSVLHASNPLFPEIDLKIWGGWKYFLKSCLDHFPLKERRSLLIGAFYESLKSRCPYTQNLKINNLFGFSNDLTKAGGDLSGELALMQVLMGLNALSPEQPADGYARTQPLSPSKLAEQFGKLLSGPTWAFGTCAAADCRLKLGGARAYACLYKAKFSSSGDVPASVAREAERCALAQISGLDEPRLVDAVQEAARRMFPALHPLPLAPESGGAERITIAHEFDFPVYLATSLATIRDGIRTGDRTMAARVAEHAREFVAHNRLAIARHERTARSPLSDLIQELFDQSYELAKGGKNDDAAVEVDAKLRVLEDRRRFDIVRFFQSNCGFDNETWKPDRGGPERSLTEPGTWIAVVARVRDHAVTILHSTDAADKTQSPQIVSSRLPIPDLDRLLADWGVRRRGGAEAEATGSAKRLLQELLGGPMTAAAAARLKRLIIVPDAWAARIPFAALMLDDGRRLSDIASLVIVPSWDYGPWPSCKSTATVAPSEPPRVLAGAYDSPMMRLEVADISMSFPTDALEASGFTFDRMLRQAASARYGILHLSTHARFDSASGGTISFHNDSADAADLTTLTGATRGIRTAGGAPSRTPLELLTLSACETGQGSDGVAGAEADGRELGLISVALRTGVRSSMGTLWRVDPEATAALMKRFYINLKNGLDKAESLRRAQRDVARLPGWSHPYYWAGFVLSGDWTPVVAAPRAGRP